MELVLKYLERAIWFRNQAVAEKDPELKADLEQQAAAYRRLAENRAKERNLPLPQEPQ